MALNYAHIHLYLQASQKKFNISAFALCPRARIVSTFDDGVHCRSSATSPAFRQTIASCNDEASWRISVNFAKIASTYHLTASCDAVPDIYKPTAGSWRRQVSAKLEKVVDGDAQSKRSGDLLVFGNWAAFLRERSQDERDANSESAGCRESCTIS